jgi:hypothetical protein
MILFLTVLAFEVILTLRDSSFADTTDKCFIYMQLFIYPVISVRYILVLMTSLAFGLGLFPVLPKPIGMVIVLDLFLLHLDVALRNWGDLCSLGSPTDWIPTIERSTAYRWQLHSWERRVALRAWHLG